jgi:hypothetical protein
MVYPRLWLCPVDVRKEAAMYVMLFILAACILATLVMQTINRRQPDRIAVPIETRKPRRRYPRD